ncbi:MAG TPA: GNAT family N-acetyltransferase, partial [Devosia sp.]|nr:GNAT family N-acetyltransferase [Devosia sp.]
PHARGRGIARELMRRAFARLAVLGHSTVYLCAKPELRNFYQNQGWALLEATVGPDGLDVFSHQTETTA